MNYIKEINAFYVRMETEPLSMGAVALWHALMHVNNRANWVQEFSVAGSVVCGKAGLSMSTFKRVRTELKEKGYIIHTARGSLAPMYEIVSAERKQVAKPVEVPVKVVEPRVKRYTALTFHTFSFFLDHFHDAPKSVEDELYEWAEILSDELVYAALERTIASGKVVWSYLKGILKNWHRDGLVMLEDVEAAEEQFRRERMGKKRAVNKEVIPAWFNRGRSHVR